MKLEGSLDAFSLPDVFQLLSLTKKSGGLHLANGQASGVVFFSQGAVTGASSDLLRQGLARRLVGMGVCDDAALRRAVERAAGESVGVARALVESGGADADVVRGYAVEHTVDAVFDLLRWPEGDFSFAMEEENPDDVGISVAADQIVAEATTRRETWESVSRVIPSPDIVLEMSVVVPDAPAVAREEWALLALVDGVRSVGELVEVSGAGPFGVVSMLSTMVQRGLLTLKDDETPDHVSLVRRRQLLLAPLEALTPTAEVPGASSAPGDAAHVAAGTGPQSGGPPPEAAQPGTTQPGTTQPGTAQPGTRERPAGPAEVEQPAASLAMPLVGGAHRPDRVVPARPEPFLPRRSVDHPEPVPARGGFSAPFAGGGAPVGPSPMAAGGDPGQGFGPARAAAAAQPADPAIERDPNVNRSLLLRLIAGVRGL